MQKFQLELLFRIIGIGSASGLLFNGDSLFIASDDSHIIYEYHIDDEALNKTALVADSYTGPLERVPKIDKADYEALALNGKDLYLFGSGSAENRNNIAHVNIETNEVLPHLDATDLYLAMQSFGEITPENFNIEAAVNDGTTWYLLQRGNGPSAQNGIFTLDGTISDMFFQIIYNPITLPEIQDVQAGFTDAVKVGNKLYFLAAAEASNAVYTDGEIKGSLIGTIDIETMTVEKTQIIGQSKFEGITLYEQNDKTISFLLCEDNDDNKTTANIYKLTIDK